MHPSSSIDATWATDSLLQVWLIRHPDCDKRPGSIVGQHDVPLSKLGERQRRELTSWLSSTPESAASVHSSDLRRCTSIAADLRSSSPGQNDPRLREQSFGDWEMRLWDNISDSERGRIWSDPWNERPPAGESLADVNARVQSWWNDKLRAQPSGKHLVFTHAGVIRCIVGGVLKMPSSEHLRLSPASPSLTVLSCDRAGGVLEQFSAQPWAR